MVILFTVSQLTENIPSLSVISPLFPGNEIVAPAKGILVLASITLPFTVFCEYAANNPDTKANNSNNRFIR